MLRNSKPRADAHIVKNPFSRLSESRHQLNSTLISFANRSSAVVMESQQKRQPIVAKATSLSNMETKGLKRKRNEFDFDGGDIESSSDVVYGFGSRRVRALIGSCPIVEHISVLNSIHVGSRSESDRSALKRAAFYLSEIAKNGEIVSSDKILQFMQMKQIEGTNSKTLLCRGKDGVELLVGNGAISALVKHLQLPEPLIGGEVIPFEFEVEEKCACAISRIAIKDKYAQQIVDEGHLPTLVNLLKLNHEGFNCKAFNGVIRRAADAITNLAHENAHIKSFVRNSGAIPFLVELLKFEDLKVQTAIAAALRTLAFRNEENKIQIVECDALSTLVLLLQSEDVALHNEAVGVIGNLVHSSPDIKQKVLHAGALQPVISLLSSCCTETQRESALLIGQFASTDSDCKVHIAQRGALKPLVDMLNYSDVHLKEMASFALGRLAQDTHNQAGVAHCGGILPLLKSLDSAHVPLQHNAAFALYGLVDNEDNIPDFVKLGGVIKLLETNFIPQQTKDCVSKTLIRLEEKLCGRVLNRMIHLMKASERSFQISTALGLAHICSPGDLKKIFIDNNGLDILLDRLAHGSSIQKRLISEALLKLDVKAAGLIFTEVEGYTTKVCLGEQYMNNEKSSDITFFIEGRPFYAHKIFLIPSSDAFRAMFDGGYREKNDKHVNIPNAKWDVFELMMRYIYTGHVNVSSSVAQDLLVLADQYLIDGLKQLCELVIAKDIGVYNLDVMYELSEDFNAKILKRSCLQFILSKFKQIKSKTWFSSMFEQALPDLRHYFNTILNGQTYVDWASKE